MSEYKSAVTLLLTVLAPSLLPRLLNVVSFLLNPSKRASLLSRHPLSLPEKVLVGLNTLWQLYRIFFPPFDLFITNRLSLLAPQHVLRSALYGRSPSTDSSAVEPLGDDHPLVELLLQKLSRPEGRTLYSRYGHETLFNCIWCTNKEDFALYSLAGIIGPYVFVAAVLGVLSLSSVSGRDSQRRTELWRAWFGWTLIVACTVEIGLKYNWDIKVTNRDGLHLAPTAHLLRSIFLLCFPVLYVLMPLSSPSEGPQDLLPALSNALNTLNFTSLTRQAVLRNPLLDRERRERQALELETVQRVRQDGHLVQSLRDNGADEHELRRTLTRWVKENVRAFRTASATPVNDQMPSTLQH